MRYMMIQARGYRLPVLMVATLLALAVASGGSRVAAAKPTTPPRFVDNGDGTVTDNQTGLMWEQQTTDGSVTDVTNFYSWSSTGSAPDGTLFTDFLPGMNCEVSPNGACPIGGKYRDWRIPNVAELQTIQAPCGLPCIDPIFGPTAAADYWSASSFTGNSGAAWDVSFFQGGKLPNSKDSMKSARAVRGGS
jgi:hypothetical protein